MDRYAHERAYLAAPADPVEQVVLPGVLRVIARHAHAWRVPDHGCLVPNHVPDDSGYVAAQPDDQFRQDGKLELPGDLGCLDHDGWVYPWSLRILAGAQCSAGSARPRPGEVLPLLRVWVPVYRYLAVGEAICAAHACKYRLGYPARSHREAGRVIDARRRLGSAGLC